MTEERVILTRAGYERMKRELDKLTKEAAEVAEQLADARSEAEFSEDAPFFDVIAEKERLDERIAHLKAVLARAEVIDYDPDPDRVSPGNRVTVWDPIEEEEVVFDLLSSYEVALGHKGVSIESPVGKALLGHKVGDTVEVEVPIGIVRYTIRNIEMIPQQE